MSGQPPFLSQTSGPPGSVYSSQNAPRAPTIPPSSPPPRSVYPPQMPNSSIYRPQQPVSHAPLHPTPFIRGGYPPTNSGLPPPSSPSRAVTMPVPGQHYNVPESNVTHPPSHIGTRPASYTPPFPTPSVHGRYPPTNPGLPPPSTPPRAETMPLPGQHYNMELNVARPPSHIGMPQEPPRITGGLGRRDDRSESDEVSPQATRDSGIDERERAPPGGRPQGRMANAPEPKGCGCAVV